MTTREVHHADAIEWLRGRGVLPGCSVVTGMPDVSEVGMSVAAWRTWFLGGARAVMDIVPDDGVTIFFQTDLRTGGTTIDKGTMVQSVAEARGMSLLFSKVVCRLPPGTLAFGRPTFTRFLAFSVAARLPGNLPIPDVIVDDGQKTWERAPGLPVVAAAMRCVRAATKSTIVVDPFCGKGWFLAVANAYGLDAIGVEKNRSRAMEARAFTVERATLGLP